MPEEEKKTVDIDTSGPDTEVDIPVEKDEAVVDIAPLNQIKVLAFKDKGEWILEQKYNIGKKVKPAEDT